MAKKTYHFGGSFAHLPYSDVVEIDGLLFVSGVVAWQEEVRAPVEGGIEAQTGAVLDRLGRILESAGASLRDVVKTTVYLTSREDFAGMNRVYARYFQEDPPARATVGVTLMEPGLLVEIDAVARASTAG
jgi:2-iminobutanoate/2-iminopropanoate deaminase